MEVLYIYDMVISIMVISIIFKYLIVIEINNIEHFRPLQFLDESIICRYSN